MHRRRMLWIGSLMLLTGSAWAEGVEPGSGGRSSDTRLVGAATLRPLGGGFVSIGGSELRYLAPGAKKWKSLLRIQGDSLYRVGLDEAQARVLAAWEKDPFIHLFTLKTGQHLQFPRPPPPDPNLSITQLYNLWFTRDGASAFILMSGRTGSTSGATVGYRAALDGSAKEPEQLFRTDGALLVAGGRYGAIIAFPPSPKQRCTPAECFPNASRLVAYEVSSEGLVEKTLLSGETLRVRGFHPVRSEDPERVALELEHTRQGGRSLLLYTPGAESPEMRDLPPPTYTSQPTGWVLLTRDAREMVFLKTLGTDLELHRLLLDGSGAERIAKLTSRHNYLSPVYGFGLRPKGKVWLHWGDDLGLIDERGFLRSVNLEPLARPMTEWAGVDIYVEEPETLWVGVEVGGGRDYVRVRFAEQEKRSKEWPAKPKGCTDLPGVAKLMQWKVQSSGGCSGGMPNPRAPKLPPLEVVKVLPDGTQIVDAGERGCIRVNPQEGCHTKCLPPHALIATPRGDVRADELAVGMPVWTRDLEGRRVAATVLRTHREPVLPTHEMVRVLLSDGRAFMATPGHPDVSGTGVEHLRVGDSYDGTRVVEVLRMPYGLGETRDLLPSGETGVYWADGVPLGSTLR